MIPAVEQFVLSVDIANKVITVRDVPGLRVDEL
jgi:ribosomal 30S subunit maturation factor RimM